MGKLGAIAGNIMIVCNFFGMYVMMKLSNFRSKKFVCLLSLFLLLVGNISYIWTWNAMIPELMYISALIIGFGTLWFVVDV